MSHPGFAAKMLTHPPYEGLFDEPSTAQAPPRVLLRIVTVECRLLVKTHLHELYQNDTACHPATCRANTIAQRDTWRENFFLLHTRH